MNEETDRGGDSYEDPDISLTFDIYFKFCTLLL
jgi:hypothetical protein